MSTPVSCEGMYSKLMDEEALYLNTDEVTRPDVGYTPTGSSTVAPKPSGPGIYRLTTIGLAILCAILLISIIAVASHSKKGGNELTPDQTDGQIQKQKQDANITELMAGMSKLQQEKTDLQKQRDELLAKIAALQATKAPAAVVTSSVTPVPITCPPNWVLFNGSCYFISRYGRSWTSSQEFCQTQGGHLAIILSAEEQTFLWNLLPRGHWNAYWFGITDEHTEDVWKWVDGTPVVLSFWEVGEPNNHIDEDCGYMIKTRVLERVAIRSWYDAPCSMSLPFICEKEM